VLGSVQSRSARFGLAAGAVDGPRFQGLPGASDSGAGVGVYMHAVSLSDSFRAGVGALVREVLQLSARSAAEEITLTMHSHFSNRRLALLLVVPAVLAAATAAAASGARHAKVTARFASPGSYKTHPAVTYDQRSVPRGSRVQVVEKPQNKPGDAGDVTLETLRVWGLTPNRRYDAYVYTRRCGATPAAVGTRTQDGPSREHYPQNEVWLDFKTNDRGNAVSRAGQYWRFNPGQASQANSVVIHAHATKAPVACVTVPFK
jgi:superoxide dismutase, Cu-Zn family